MTVSIDFKNSNTLSIKCSPSNCHGVFMVETNNPINEIRVFDVNEKLVHHENYFNTIENYSLDLKNLENGIYFVSFTSGNKIYNQKIVVE